MNTTTYTVAKVSPRQFRAARELLGWTRDEAASLCGVGRATLTRIESGGTVQDRTFADVVRGFTAHGIVFYNDDRGLGVAIAAPR
nr:helix-turn-helix transcriptional regulator [uncultured Devosia sp.]